MLHIEYHIEYNFLVKRVLFTLQMHHMQANMLYIIQRKYNNKIMHLNLDFE